MKIIKGEYISGDGKTYYSYGLEMDTVCVEDISPDRVLVERLAARCEAAGIFPSQLQEIVEDFLTEEETVLR